MMLFIAGHAQLRAEQPFPGHDAEPVAKASGALRWRRGRSSRKPSRLAKGRRVLFIDTCHSGNAYNQKLGNAAYHANIIAYTAARFDQEAMEDTTLGHGLFTYAVVEGLEGKGYEAKRELSTKELAEYVVKRVEELAKALRRRAGAAILQGPRRRGLRAGEMVRPRQAGRSPMKRPKLTG